MSIQSTTSKSSQANTPTAQRKKRSTTNEIAPVINSKEKDISDFHEKYCYLLDPKNNHYPANLLFKIYNTIDKAYFFGSKENNKLLSDEKLLKDFLKLKISNAKHLIQAKQTSQNRTKNAHQLDELIEKELNILVDKFCFFIFHELNRIEITSEEKKKEVDAYFDSLKKFSPNSLKEFPVDPIIPEFTKLLERILNFKIVDLQSPNLNEKNSKLQFLNELSEKFLYLIHEINQTGITNQEKEKKVDAYFELVKKISIKGLHPQFIEFLDLIAKIIIQNDAKDLLIHKDLELLQTQNFSELFDFFKDMVAPKMQTLKNNEILIQEIAYDLFNIASNYSKEFIEYSKYEDTTTLLDKDRFSNVDDKTLNNINSDIMNFISDVHKDFNVNIRNLLELSNNISFKIQCDHDYISNLLNNLKKRDNNS